MTARRAVVLRRAAVVAAALACAVVLLFLPGPEGPAAGGGPDAGTGAEERAAVQRLLDRRARAVLDGDEEAFLAGVDPAAREFRNLQRREFRNLRRLPLASWRYRLAGTGTRALPGSGGTRGIAARVVLEHRIEGFDTEPVASTEYWTFTRRGGGWVLSSDTGGRSGGPRGAVHLWEQGEMTVVRGRHSLVLGLADRDGAKAYADLADAAVPAVTAAWGGKWAERVVVVVPGSPEGMAELLGGEPAAYRDMAAVTTGRPGGAPGAAADRVVVNPEAFGGLGPLGRRVVTAHETAHVATRSATTDATPLWLSEGFADWAGYRGTGTAPVRAAPELRAEVAAGRPPARLPGDEAFAGGREGLATAYEAAWLACRMTAERWGEDALVDLYRAVGAGTGRADPVDAAMREVLGVGLEEFTEDWRAYTLEELS
ncbi:hypothetical protein GCM10010406_28650 [Streptomyces thermolineatus]|uniref:Uncharacterized protein n=1 Tax=Streptomyces thermolineatus TaxID=44033 RepID=A0ABN3LUZ3_9ACTN